MNFIYNILLLFTDLLIKVGALFNPKLKLFVEGRKDVFQKLSAAIKPSDKIIWFHAASLGEFEQGLPVMEGVKSLFPDYKILVTFFSPSGFEVKKNHPLPDLITYLPLDASKNAKTFVKLTKPSLVIFIKYEFWPNYLKFLKKEHIPVIAIASIFRKEQLFFKWYGSFMRNRLKTIHHFFVQDENSKSLLKSIGIKEISLSGDTRFDRVVEILERDNTLDFIEEFKKQQLCLVAGSTWPEDEAALIAHINDSDRNVKYVIAPHTIKEDKINKLKERITKSTVLYSEMTPELLVKAEVLIIDTIGLLTKIYSYADIAYVGGGLGNTGLHNTLEPAVFGIPVIIGLHYDKFKEARELVELGGIISIESTKALQQTLNMLFSDTDKRKTTGSINADYILKNRGAKVQILSFIRTLIEN
ncbi:3-deoxy-D-manno-octulosonic acid transferase [Flavobacteriaceae bacterium M23B6Z8]